MAKTITPSEVSYNGAGRVFLWENIEEGDSCDALTVQERQVELSVQLLGTIGGSTITITGSLDQSNFTILDDAYGQAMSYTAVSVTKPVGPAVNAIKPAISGGSGVDVDIYILIMDRR